MGLELKTNDYKAIINSLIITSGMPFDRALDLLLGEVDTYQIEDFIELLLDKTRNESDKE